MIGAMTGATLVVDNLQTHFVTEKGVVKAVDGVSFEVGRGEILGLVGESGSGKSITGFSILGLLDPPGRVVGGRILFQGEDLVGLPASEMRDLRGRRIAMIFQDPMMTLNPVLQHRDPDGRDGSALMRRWPAGSAGTRARHARHGRHPLAGGAAGILSAPVFRWHASARGDRHRTAPPAGTHHRG